ncbi:hypothetical protein EDD99_6448 [Streptomyces sp. 846.5]|nr:hypothetical protein EDD99_6448 [Streptomyces sp. 846.5]
MNHPQASRSEVRRHRGPDPFLELWGQNTRVKRIKRYGYGRADLDLLRAGSLHRA